MIPLKVCSENERKIKKTTGVLYTKLLEGNESRKPPLKEEKEDRFFIRDIFIKGIIYVTVIKVDGDGFLDVGVWKSAIKLAMAST